MKDPLGLKENVAIIEVRYAAANIIGDLSRLDLQAGQGRIIAGDAMNL